MKILKNSGAFLLLFLTLMVVISTILFFFNISISSFHLIISFIISGISYYFISKKNLIKKEFLYTIILSIIVIFISTLISTYTFDRSRDGNT